MTLTERGKKLGVTRQRIWQIDKTKKGLCQICGVPAMLSKPVVSSVRKSKYLTVCKKHNDYRIKLIKNLPDEKRLKNIEKVKAWRKRNKEKCRLYSIAYRKMKNAK